MKLLNLLLFILAVQSAFSQKINPDKFYPLHAAFKTVEDSIAAKVNPTNTLIYKICDEYQTFYFIKDSLHWTGYFIKNMESNGMTPSSIIDSSGMELKPFLTELYVFNADSLYTQLVKKNIYKVQQISEDAIQEKLSEKPKNGVRTVHSLPQSSNDCSTTIVIYGKENKTVTYRGLLISSEKLHVIPTLKIFYESELLLLNRAKKKIH